MVHTLHRNKTLQISAFGAEGRLLSIISIIFGQRARFSLPRSNEGKDGGWLDGMCLEHRKEARNEGVS